MMKKQNMFGDTPSFVSSRFGVMFTWACALLLACGEESKKEGATDSDTITDTSVDPTDTADTVNTDFVDSDTLDSSPPTPLTTIEYDGLNGLVRNPIISHIFTADPSANVFNGRIYLYPSHDRDGQAGYNMLDYHVFSTNDLVNWQDHGVVLYSPSEVRWASYFYAPDAAYGAATGKYYLYFPNGGTSIGVAVSDDPGGPFVDALGHALVDDTVPGVEDVDWVFDPTCFVDEDGQAYLYFGGGMSGDNLRVIRLGEDMISLADESATTIVAPDFFEAPFVHKRNNKYYLSYSTTFDNHDAYIDYMMSDDPMTGFEYVGTVLPNPANNDHGNSHQSIVEYEGQWYIFYHNRALALREGVENVHYQRSVTLDSLTYDTDDTIIQVPAIKGEVHQLRNLDAFTQLEAETIGDQRGIEVDFVEQDGANVGVMITDIQNEDWIGYSQMDFGTGAVSFHVRASSLAADAMIYLYVDGADVFSNLPGKQIGACAVASTGGTQNWTDVVCPILPTSGVHDLYLRFAGTSAESVVNVDYFVFK